MTDSPKTFLSTKEVAELLDVNEKVVYSLISDKGLPACKVTGKWIFPRHLVERWIESHVVNYPADRGIPSGSLLIIVGSNDPLLERTIALFNSLSSDCLAVFGSTGSLGGIRALNRKVCQIASSHLMHSDEEDYNFVYLEELMEGEKPVVVNFCFRDQGIMVKRGNPKDITGIPSLARGDVTIVNRQEGTGTRLLLEHELKKAGIEPGRVKGYRKTFPTHLAVGLEVLSGKADAALGIKAIASLLNLDFIPIRKERYDLLISREHFFSKPVQRFLGLLQERAFRSLSEVLDGYDISMSGKMLFHDTVKQKNI